MRLSKTERALSIGLTLSEAAKAVADYRMQKNLATHEPLRGNRNLKPDLFTQHYLHRSFSYGVKRGEVTLEGGKITEIILHSV